MSHGTCFFVRRQLDVEPATDKDIRGAVYGLWIRFMVYGLWFMVYGLWFMVYGLWFMVYCLPGEASDEITAVDSSLTSGRYIITIMHTHTHTHTHTMHTTFLFASIIWNIVCVLMSLFLITRSTIIMASCTLVTVEARLAARGLGFRV